MTLKYFVSAITLFTCAWTGTVFADDAPNSKEEVLKGQTQALDDKLKDLFDVPETPAAQALGVTGSAIAHPDTIKDVALQVLAAVSNHADLSQGAALEFAPFRTAVFKGKTLADFNNLGGGTLLASSLALSLGALSEPAGASPGVRYAFGFRVPFLDDTDYHRNAEYRHAAYAGLNDCASALRRSELGGTDPSPADLNQSFADVEREMTAWDASKKSLTDTTARAAQLSKELDGLANDPGSNAQILVKIEQTKLKIAANTQSAAAATADGQRSQAWIKSHLDSIGTAIGNYEDGKKTPAHDRLAALRKTFADAGGYNIDPSKIDAANEAGRAATQISAQHDVAAVCAKQTDSLSHLTDVLQGNRFELSTSTTVANPSAGKTSWQQTVIAAAYERHYKVGYFGFAGRGLIYNPDAVKVQLDGGARAGFKTGLFAGSVSAAAGAKDLDSAAFVFSAGASSSLAIADTFLARLGMLTTYEHGPGLGLSAYLAVATANGEDFFTHIINVK